MYSFVSISFLIPRGDRVTEKGKKVKKDLQEKCTAENLVFVLHKNINSKLDLFPDKFNPNKNDQGILKGNFRTFIYMFYVFHKSMMSLFKITLFR